jgi:cell division septum initiation protein DivIVA
VGDPGIDEPPTYQALAALDELVELVQSARGVPMSASCVVPRGHILGLIEDIRDALPSELQDAQDVLDRRDDLVAQARARLAGAVEQGEVERERLVAAAREEAGELMRSAHEHGTRQVAAAQAQAQAIVAAAHAEAGTTVAAARHQAVRLGEDTEVYRVAAARAGQLTEEATAAARKMAAEVEEYVDARLASFAELLTRTLRQVEMGRQTLRERATGAGTTQGPPPTE